MLMMKSAEDERESGDTVSVDRKDVICCNSSKCEAKEEVKMK